MDSGHLPRGKFTTLLFTGLALCLAACSSSTTELPPASGIALLGAEQDLSLDADGTVMLMTFDADAGPLGSANLACSGGQSALFVSQFGSAYQITWSDRVTPSHQVQVVGVAEVEETWHPVTTSDSSQPSWSVSSADQTAGMGGDSISISFSGPRVVPASVTAPTSWDLEINGVSMDLSDAAFVFTPASQSLDITLGAMTNLWSSYELSCGGGVSVADVTLDGSYQSGTASGDSSAPTLISANQNIIQDSYGSTVDFEFSEAMDPVFSTLLSNFRPSAPDFAVDVQQTADNILRVRFTGPVVPGFDQVELYNLYDLHGNAGPSGPQAVVQPAPEINDYAVGYPLALAVENSGGDQFVIRTSQAFDPDFAVDPTRWVISIDGSPVDLATQSFSYDFLNRELTIDLDFDMSIGAAFSVTGAGVIEVDGESFTGVAAGLVTGESSEPFVNNADQNRSQDISGKLVDVMFNEELDGASAGDENNYAMSGGLTVLDAEYFPLTAKVRLTLDNPVIPGDYTLTVSNVADLAGNVMSAPQAGIAIGSTDQSSPSMVAVSAMAPEGADNDTLSVYFDDNMLASEVEDAANWSFESPVGQSFSVAAATISYDAVGRSANITFDGAPSTYFRRGDDYRLTLMGMRDVGGNTVSTSPYSGNVVAERTLPRLDSVWRDGVDGDEAVVRFSEPCDWLDDLYHETLNPTGTRYELRDSGGMLRGMAATATAEDGGLGVRLTFGLVIAATDTMTVYGVTDLVGNPLFEGENESILDEDPQLPSLSTGWSVLNSVSGERNDEIWVTFDRLMSSWQLLEPNNYTLLSGGVPVDLSRASFRFDGFQTVTIDLDESGADSLQSGSTYDLTVNQVRSVQGIHRTSSDTEYALPVGGDAQAPTVGTSDARIDPQGTNSIMVFVDEAVASSVALDPLQYDYALGNLATATELVEPSVVRVTFAVPVAVGMPLDIAFMQDLAGNATGSINRTVSTADSNGPNIAQVVGTIVAGEGEDYIVVTFDEPLDAASAMDPANYSVDNGGALDCSGAQFSYDSVTNSVRLELPAGQDLRQASALTVDISAVLDVSGNSMDAPVSVAGSMAGDASGPAFAGAFRNYREDASGLSVDFHFDEDIDTAWAGDTANWSASGGQPILDIEMFDGFYGRARLAAPLASGETLTVSGLTDLGGNSDGSLVVTPRE
ncbi:MAG: hypothetical protein QF724_00285 [Planctomycetota bacterium]|jgi:hypothetical protein|nr:hypothetical protein [Planctomycetota bacterium]